ncbi:MAG TPA: transcriptional regulator [Advenella kashmirensis]|uniref:Transcriptional regulator n=1 Tax=Advenella kashmirensis TaxID=310575 RepID=A0A356LIV7_9BURK|nr:transcriptional regulator [Advenella kashmirensis]
MTTLNLKRPITADLPDLVLTDLIQIFADKWSMPILYCLVASTEPIRYKTLLRQLAPVTEKDLSRQLRFLRFKGLVNKQISLIDASCTVYEATDRARGLRPAFESLARWLQTYK